MSLPITESRNGAPKCTRPVMGRLWAGDGHEGKSGVTEDEQPGQVHPARNAILLYSMLEQTTDRLLILI